MRVLTGLLFGAKDLSFLQLSVGLINRVKTREERSVTREPRWCMRMVDPVGFFHIGSGTAHVTVPYGAVRCGAVQLEFHGTDTDTDTDTDVLADFRARIVARMSACPATSPFCLLGAGHARRSSPTCPTLALFSSRGCPLGMRASTRVNMYCTR